MEHAERALAAVVLALVASIALPITAAAQPFPEATPVPSFGLPESTPVPSFGFPERQPNPARLRAAYVPSVRIGPEYPPGSPSGWVCMALTENSNAVLAYSPSVDPAPACQEIQELMIARYRAADGGWGLQGFVESTNNFRQQYANDPGCLPGCVPGLRDHRLSPVCDIMAGLIEYVVFSADPNELLCGLLQPASNP